MKSLRREGWWSWIVLWCAVGVLDVMVLAVGVLADMLLAVVVLAVCCGMRRTDDERRGVGIYVTTDKQKTSSSAAAAAAVDTNLSSACSGRRLERPQYGADQ